jgi:hypothetical protein
LGDAGAHVAGGVADLEQAGVVAVGVGVEQGLDKGDFVGGEAVFGIEDVVAPGFPYVPILLEATCWRKLG